MDYLHFCEMQSKDLMRTAIIFTGGLGTRMAPVTQTLNKSLIPIDGKPTLEKILLQLDHAGIGKILVLTGYLGWQVEYVTKRVSNLLRAQVLTLATPTNFSPAERLLQSSDLWVSSSEVVLVYCDNYMNSDEVVRHLNTSKENAVMIHLRSPGNILINESNSATYSAQRLNTLSFVELGYWRLTPYKFFRQLFEYRDLQRALTAYTRCEKVSASIVQDYTSLSTLERYVHLRARTRKTVLVDRDGLLVASVKKGEYLNQTKQVRFLEENIDFLKQISSRYKIDYIVATNQAGIERKLITMAEVQEVNQFVAIQLLEIGVPILAFFVCPHHWESNCNCRKPKPGLLYEATSKFLLNPSDCLFIGDTESDVLAGQAAGFQSFLIPEDVGASKRAEIQGQFIDFLESLENDS